MPVYEYYCPRCQKEFELRRPMSQASDPAACPTCGGESQKLVSAAASKIDFYIRPPVKGAFRGHPGGTKTRAKAPKKR